MIKGFDYYLDLVNEEKNLIRQRMDLQEQIGLLDHQDIKDGIAKQLRNEIFRITDRINYLISLKMN